MDRPNGGRSGLRRRPPPSPLGTALWLAGQGYWAVPITAPDDPRSPNAGKAPIGRGWGRERTTRSLFAVYREHPTAGVGVALGPGPGLVDLEVDDPDGAKPLLAELFPGGPPPTLGWTSARGEHRLYAWDDRLAASRSSVLHLAGGALEFRIGANGKQLGAVCPPSRGSDGRPRRWNEVWSVASCPEALVELVLRQSAPRAVARRPKTDARRRSGNSAARYALTALDREAEMVRAAELGTRNSTLNRASFRLGQLVGSGAIDRQAVEATLAAAAMETGLGNLEVERTIRSGLEAGLLHPRGPGTGQEG